MAIPGTIEITFNDSDSVQQPATAVYFDMLKANEAIQRMREMDLEILNVEVIP